MPAYPHHICMEEERRMKIIKYIAGVLALAAFFLVIDSSGVGFRKHLIEIRKWASGEVKHLQFKAAQK